MILILLYIANSLCILPEILSSTEINMQNMQTEIIILLHVQLLNINSFAKNMTNFSFITYNQYFSKICINLRKYAINMKNVNMDAKELCNFI